jgi:pentapeptide repeat protein
MPRLLRQLSPIVIAAALLVHPSTPGSAARQPPSSRVSPSPQPAGGGRGGTGQVPNWAFWLQQTWAGAELLALLFAAYQLWARRAERRQAEAEAAAVALKAANYQAWSVVNTAQGKGGSGGRIDALQDLNRNGVSLAGVQLDSAWLVGIALPGARLDHASLRGAILTGANLQGANLEAADVTGADLRGADLRGAFLKGVALAEAQLGTADLRNADLENVRNWREIRSASYLQIEGVRHAPAGFCEWAIGEGAVEGMGPVGESAETGFSTHFKAV